MSSWGPKKVSLFYITRRFVSITIRDYMCVHVSQLTYLDTGKSLSEALILALTNLQYDDRLFIELQVQ